MVVGHPHVVEQVHEDLVIVVDEATRDEGVCETSDGDSVAIERLVFLSFFDLGVVEGGLAEEFVDVELLEVLFWVLAEGEYFEDTVIHVGDVIHITLGILFYLLHLDIGTMERFLVCDQVCSERILFDHIVFVVVLGDSDASLGIVGNDDGNDIIGRDLHMIVGQVLEEILVVLQLWVAILYGIFFLELLVFYH